MAADRKLKVCRMDSDSSDQSSVLQLRISLRCVGPPVCRRVLIPEQTTIAQLHQVMQLAMGWQTNTCTGSSSADGVTVAIATVRSSSSTAQTPCRWRRLACTNMSASPACTTSPRGGRTPREIHERS
ncbi:hypothetical protein EYW47_36580 [Paraburkholderia silviterrae]|uniref:Plasmid pRiA4b Orf3-like domain-containing protein n=1 Tax=Paraburkholderia silviterrae TaxID=2528715 RepID=A0A4R5LZ32_9BURK|nr:hypothetical protein EYW47_36580 [Paraburkholderia silviterrae]